MEVENGGRVRDSVRGARARCRSPRPSCMLFYPRRYASAGTSYGPVSVCVCLSQVGFLSKRFKRMDGIIWFWAYGASFDLLSFITVFLGNSGICKNKRTSLWNFFLNSGLRKFRHGIWIVERAMRKMATLRA